VAGQILNNARALAVLVRRQLFDDACPVFSRAGECCIDVWHAHLDDVRSHAIAWRNPIATDLGDNHGAVRSDAQLGSVRITDPHPFRKSECGL
jgi:hypothetical protein